MRLVVDVLRFRSEYDDDNHDDEDGDSGHDNLYHSTLCIPNAAFNKSISCKYKITKSHDDIYKVATGHDDK